MLTGSGGKCASGAKASMEIRRCPPGGVQQTPSSLTGGTVRDVSCHVSSPHACVLSCTNTAFLSDSPPGSPEHAGISGRDSKENREPMMMMGMMSMKRRRSVKISSVSLESSAWQNDSLHILTSTSDYRSMNDFLMKKVSIIRSALFLTLHLLKSRYSFIFSRQTEKKTFFHEKCSCESVCDVL